MFYGKYMFYGKFEGERQYMFYCDFKMLKESFMEMMEYYLYKLMIQIVCEVVKMVLGFNFITGNEMSMGFCGFFQKKLIWKRRRNWMMKMNQLVQLNFWVIIIKFKVFMNLFFYNS